MTNSKYVPKRRFKEFVGDGEWEQNQLKELAEFSKGRGYSKSELQTDGQPIILYGRLYTKYETVISTVDTFTHIKENSVLSKGGEVLVPSSGESAEDIARASVVAEEGIIIGGDLNIIKLCKKIEPIFLSLAISNGKQKEEISKRAQGKSVVHVNNDDLKQVNVLFPSISEQIQIGKFFQTIDALISNHQHKLDKLKDLKKAYLTEMFPAEGERVPKRRFPGFEGEWEMTTLGETVKVTMGQSPDGTTYSDAPGDYILVQGNSDLENGWVKPRIWTTQITKSAEKGDIIMSVRAPAGQVGRTGYNVVIGRGVAAIKGNEFIYQLLVKLDIDAYWKQVSSGSTFDSLNSDNIKNAEIKVPSIEEQEKIGIFFHKLDNSISLEQQKLDKLNDLKRAYLNELFV